MLEEIAPNIRSFEVFLAVQRTKSFSLAGKLLGMAQPTVTQRVQVLEQMVGSRLFDRGTGEVRLTPTGLTLVGHAERIVAARDDMVRALNGQASAANGTLRIAASDTPGNYVMPVVLHGFHEEHPGVRILMSITDSRDAVERLFDGQAELGIVGDLQPDGRLVCEPVLDDEIVVIAKPGDPISSEKAIEIPELLNRPRIIREPGSATRVAVETLLRDSSKLNGLKIAMQLDSTEAIKLAVRVGAGVALVSRRSVDSEVAAGQLVTRRIGRAGLRRQICAVRIQGMTLSTPAQHLWDRIAGVRNPNEPGPRGPSRQASAAGEPVGAAPLARKPGRHQGRGLP